MRSNNVNRPQPIRTALFVPGNRPDRVDKAINSISDVVIIDLEDAVPPAEKEAARSVAGAKVSENAKRRIFVRVNAPGSAFLPEDIKQVIVKGLAGIMLPKVESPGDVRKIHQLLTEAEVENNIEKGAVSLILLIESAAGVQHVFEIARERTNPPRIITVAFGAVDYVLDLGIEITREGAELAFPRSRIAVACRAAGIEAPLDTPFVTDLKDEQGLRADALRAKQLGFQGKLCVHPAQLAACNEVFSPTKEEILYAQKVVQAYEDAEARGIGAIQVEGRLIDTPVVERSRRVLMLAEKLRSSGGGI